MKSSVEKRNIASIIIKRPHVTEKVTTLVEKNIHTFIVDRRANKIAIKEAIYELYKVKPLKINIVNVKGKEIMNRGKTGFKKGFKKALVYLKEGDKIEVI